MFWLRRSRQAVIGWGKYINFKIIYNVHNVKFSTLGRGLSTLSVDNGIGVWELNRPPVNSINLDVAKDIVNILIQTEENKCRGLVITSASPKIFSAGLDLQELYKPDPQRLWTMWHTMQEIAIKMLTGNFVTAVAINGHASAGGVLLSMFSDYRVAVDANHTLGFNDTAVGIVPLVWVVNLISHALTTRKAELAIIRSSLFTPKEALEVGMVDELASDKTDAIAKCKGFINSLDHIAPSVISKTRQIAKGGSSLSLLMANREKDCDEFVSKILNSDTQLLLGNYLKALKSKKAK